MAAADSPTLYRALLNRFHSLEASHHDLRQQVELLLQDKTSNKTLQEQDQLISDSGDVTSFPGWGGLPGAYFSGSPYRNVLEYMGHAVHVTRIASWEIIYWNRAAEKLFGYKDYEVVGQRAVKLLFDEEHHPSALAIMERLSNGGSWSGQLPLKKRSGQNFMATVTKSPLYEDGELVGIVTVSSGAAVFNNTNSGNMRTHQDHATEQPNVRRINFKKGQWHPPLQIAALPQLPSSISNLASKLLLRKRGDDTYDTGRCTRESEETDVESHDAKADRPPRAPIAKPASSLSTGRSETEAIGLEKEESTSEFAQPSKIALKFVSKLQIGAIRNLEKVMDGTVRRKGSEDNSVKEETAYETCSQRGPTESTSRICNHDACNQTEDDSIGNSDAVERKQPDVHVNPSVTNGIASAGAFSGAYQRCFEIHKPADQLPRSSSELDGRKSLPHLSNIRSVESEDASSRQADSHKSPSSGNSSDTGNGGSLSKDYSDLHMLVKTEIHWEDLQLREEIGQGSFAVVYRGVWNGSDVAVKVYLGNQYTEQTLLDYKKEIDIIRRLRHPNVLLFMGAVCTGEKLAMVTEYLTRGSLFKTLHQSNQSLDIRRRMRMAIDVARGMNYLHHRNPPIVHRDLKSSNLLVDKSWTVKVGDFGLSKLKCATFLTAKSGRGTPQWMAPEVLRNEPSTEKSDVFSFGVILWELMTERIPWNDLNPLQVVGVVGFMDGRLDLPENIDPKVSSIISDCWLSNPDGRPSFEDIIHKMTDLVHTGVIGRTATAP